MRVLMMPDYRVDNPYQSLLAGGLGDAGVEVLFPKGYRRGLPLTRAVRDQSPAVDVLHLHWITPYLRVKSPLGYRVYARKLTADLALLRLSGVGLVWTVHNHLSHEAKHAKVELKLRQRLARRVHRLIVHDEASRQLVAKDYQVDAGKILVIPHGHYRSVYPPAVPAAQARMLLGLPETGRVFLTMGMLRPYKGVERLLDVWGDLQELVHDHTLLVAGKPRDDAYGHALRTRLPAAANVRFHFGFVPDDRVHLYFSAADVVVLPFEKILTSGSLLLAMSYGKPIIAPSVTSLKRTIGDADDLFFPPDEADGLVAAMKRSLQCDLADLGRRTARACDALDWQTIGQATAQVYHAAASH